MILAGWPFLRRCGQVGCRIFSVFTNALYMLESSCYIHTPHGVMRCMSTLNEYPSCLNELAGATPREKAACMRSLLPSIEAALSSCQTLKDIWVVLENRGLGTAYRAFPMTVWRPRRSKKATAPRSWDYGSAPQKPGQQTDPLNVEGRDPLENLKRLEENRPSFHWRGTNLPSAGRWLSAVARGINERSEVGNQYACFGRARIECGTSRHDSSHKIRCGRENSAIGGRRDQTYLVHACRIPLSS